MSYNILADYNARNHPDLYRDVPWDAMGWDSRRRLIIREIRHWDPDLVCLQVRAQSLCWRWHTYTVLHKTITLCYLEVRRWIGFRILLQEWSAEGMKVYFRYNTSLLHIYATFRILLLSVLKQQLCDHQRRTGDTRDGCAMFWKSKRYEWCIFPLLYS